MTDIIKNAPSLSFKNSDKITDEIDCGCYFCMNTFKGVEIEDWADGGQTALCPHCHVDSVIPNETNENILARAAERWFCAASEDDTEHWYNKTEGEE